MPAADGPRGSGSAARQSALADPRHPAVAPDVADVIHMQLPEREIAEVSVVGRVRMSGEERGTRAAAIPFDARARSEHGDAAVGERICSAALGHQQRRARIPLQVLGVLGESADQEDRVSVVKGDGHERAVGIALRLQGQRAQGPGRDLGDQCSRALRVRGRRDIDVVQRLRRVACRSGVCVFAHQLCPLSLVPCPLYFPFSLSLFP